MLAEPRRKQKLSIDPRGSNWSKGIGGLQKNCLYMSLFHYHIVKIKRSTGSKIKMNCYLPRVPEVELKL